MGEDIFRVGPELSIILLTMIILPIFLKEKFVSQIGLGVAAVPFIFDLGIVGKYNTR
jgi:hypothetical protein